MPAPPLIPPHIAAARARAAIAYSGLEHDQIAERSGLSVAVIRRITAKSQPRDGTLERLLAIAEACDGVPRWFMEHGWHPPADVLEASRQGVRLEAVEQQVNLLLEVANAQAPGGELGRRLRAVRTNRQDRPPPGSPPGPDAPQGNGGS